jgi:hypothetical protein
MTFEAAYDLADRLLRELAPLRSLPKPDRRTARQIIVDLANDAIEDGIEEYRHEGGSNAG